MTDFQPANLEHHVKAFQAAVDELALQQIKAEVKALPGMDESLRQLEATVRKAYLTEPLFHSQVHMGARVIDHMFPGVSRGESLRAALLILAIGRQ